MTAERLYISEVFTDPVFPEGIEGPAVDHDGTLYLVSFQRRGTIGKVTPDGKASLLVTLPEGSTGNGIRFDSKGDMLIADYTGHNVLRIDMQSQRISVHAHNPAMNQPNDIAIMDNDIVFASDPRWADSTGNIWRVDPDGSTHLLESDMGTTNGIEVSPDNRRLYVNESVQRNVWVYDLAVDGTISNKRLLIRFPDGGMDGMRTDIDGNLYITRYGKGVVAVVSPAGELLREIPLHGERPTNIAFGGPDGRTAYVTIQEKGNVERFRVERPGRAWALWQQRR